MANTDSARKRIRQTEKRTARNNPEKAVPRKERKANAEAAAKA